MSRVLLVEDDSALGSTLKEQLEREGCEVRWATSKSEATKIFTQEGIDLCILDVGLPDGSGLDLGRDIKLNTSSMPIIFLTAMNSAEYRLEGYEIGAEEYIPKPFFLKELLLRVRRVLGRAAGKSVQNFGPITVDFEQMSIKFADGTIEFPASRDFDLLKLLIETAPQPLSREGILKHFGASENGPTSRVVDNSILRLRQLIRRAGVDFIRSVRGVGYQWVVE